jgi:hypothetical protein
MCWKVGKERVMLVQKQEMEMSVVGFALGDSCNSELFAPDILYSLMLTTAEKDSQG